MMNFIRILCFCGLALTTNTLITYTQADFKTSDDDPIINKRVEFWIKIYSELTEKEGVIHDAKYPEIIYEKLDFSEFYKNSSLRAATRKEKIDQKIRTVKNFYIKSLNIIHKNQFHPEKLSETEKRIYELFINVNEPNKYFAATQNKRIRFQLGQKDKFISALKQSGKYLSLIEQAFINKGLPKELSRLPFVESSFNVNAKSKVGASGIWQFMTSTGKQFLTINPLFDDRNDPIKASTAAAELLKMNYQTLGSWPLAVTAYNHGRKGMMRATSVLGTDSLGEIIQNYRSRNFGFASSNFYPELLAAIECEKNSEKYYGKIERYAPIDFAEIVLSDFIELRVISKYTKIPMETLQEFNPGFTENLVKGIFYLPSSYVLRIPSLFKEQFLSLYGQIPQREKHTAQKNPLIVKNFN